jgi:hypothetical protein
MIQVEVNIAGNIEVHTAVAVIISPTRRRC